MLHDPLIATRRDFKAVPPRFWRVLPTFGFAGVWCAGIIYVIFIIFHQMSEDKQVYFCAGLLYLISAEKEEIKLIVKGLQKTVYQKLFHERYTYADGPSQYAFNTATQYLIDCGIMASLTQYSVHDFWAGHWEAYIVGNLIYGGEPHMWSYFWGDAVHLEYWAPEYDRYGNPVPRTSKLVLRAKSARPIDQFTAVAESYNTHRSTRHRSVPTSGDHSAVLAVAGPAPTVPEEEEEEEEEPAPVAVVVTAENAAEPAPAPVWDGPAPTAPMAVVVFDEASV